MSVTALLEQDLAYQEISRLNNELTNMQRELAKRNAELERLNLLLQENQVILRVQHDQLVNANTELKQAARQRDEFLAMVSHELRTPLNAILGLSESLRELLMGPLTPAQTQALMTIDASGHHLLTLINDILDLAKIQVSAMVMEIARTSVAMLCSSSLKSIRENAQKKRLRVLQSVDINAEWVDADARRLKQVLVNLLSNAVKFTPEGGQIGLQAEGDPDASVIRFIVWDTGIGIPAEHLAKLFKPFVQLDSALNRRYSGIGLGLVLVAQITQMHGGSVSVESEPGKGSRFTITLPWHTGSGEFDSPDKSAASEPGEHPRLPLEQTAQAVVVPAHDAPLILLAEDDAGNALSLAAYLQAQGYRLNIARDGTQVMELVTAECPALILMDIQMPIMDGLQTIRLLRHESDKAIAQVPIIALTALVMKGDRERCLAAGANEYIPKPVNLKQLKRTIQNLIKV